MRFWMRELAGWLLVALGLLMAFWVWVLSLQRNTVLTPWPMTIFGIFVFRGGIHLLKVAIAARICLQAQDRLYPAADLRPRPSATALRRIERG